MRRVSPISRPRAPGSVQTRSLYVKQHQALDMLKGKSIPIRETEPSNTDVSLSVTVDRTALSPCLTVSSGNGKSLRFPFDYNTTKLGSSADPVITTLASHLSLPETQRAKVGELIETLWQIFREKEAFSLETRIGSSNGALEVRGARFGFDDAAFKSSGRQEGVHQLRDKKSEVPEEVEAEKDGIVYVK